MKLDTLKPIPVARRPYAEPDQPVGHRKQRNVTSRLLPIHLLMAH